MKPMKNGNTLNLAWTATQEQLGELASELMQHKRIAVDTESNGLHAYKEQVCLIQFSAGGVDYLVDPLALKDLAPLGPVFADPHIEKVFHAAEYDLICLRRDYGFTFANLFDTMLAGRVLGKKEFSLAAMIEEAFGVHLDKKLQRANWAKRPLPEEWMDYARLDTHYLLDLRDHLGKELATSDRKELAEEDFSRLCHEPAAKNGSGGNDPCWRISGSRDLSTQEVSVLSELCAFREIQARQVNVPPFKIITNEVLLALAVQQPETYEELAGIRGIGTGLIRHHSARILDAIRRGRSNRNVKPPHYQPRPNEDYLQRVEMLRAWRKNTALGLGVPSDVVLPREVMEQIAMEKPEDMAGLKIIMGDLPWRMAHFGDDILKILKIKER